MHESSRDSVSAYSSSSSYGSSQSSFGRWILWLLPNSIGLILRSTGRSQMWATVKKIKHSSIQQKKLPTVLNELIEDRNAIKVATKPTCTIDIIRVQFNLQHKERKTFSCLSFFFHGYISRWWICYHDSILAVPHDNKANFRLQLEVDSVFLHLDPCFVIWHFDTSKERLLWLECQSNLSYCGHRRALTKCRRQWACSWRGERKARWCRQSHNWL